MGGLLMISPTSEQFVEIVTGAVLKYVEVHPDTNGADIEWQCHMAARIIAGTLRQYGINVPSVGEHYSEFTA